MECTFEEALTENFYNAYYSTMYIRKRWCVGLQTKQTSRTFYKSKTALKDNLFVLELSSPRSSIASSLYSEDSHGSTGL